MHFKDLFEKLYPSYTNKLWKFTFMHFTNYYIQFIIFQSSKYNPKSVSKMIEKVKKEVEMLDGLFKSVLSSKEADAHKGHLEDLISCFCSEPEATIIHIVNLKILFKKNFNQKILVVCS